MYLDARNHYPQIKHHTPPPKQGNNKNPEPPKILGNTQKIRKRKAGAHPSNEEQTRGLVVSKPNSVSGSPTPTTSR
jgi:hypothetical protein